MPTTIDILCLLARIELSLPLLTSQNVEAIRRNHAELLLNVTQLLEQLTREN